MSHTSAPADYDRSKLDRAVLQSLRRDLRDVLIPELSSENARGTARLLDEMLGWLALFYATLAEIEIFPQATLLVADKARTIADSLLTGIEVQRSGLRGGRAGEGLPHV